MNFPNEQTVPALLADISITIPPENELKKKQKKPYLL